MENRLLRSYKQDLCGGSKWDNHNGYNKRQTPVRSEFTGLGAMKITYDPLADAAYIYLTPAINQVDRTYACDPREVGGQINLDFDALGRLVGIEVLDASHKLPEALLKRAEMIA